FQAEDGIRDGHVTGVQTCALPISSDNSAASLRHGGDTWVSSDIVTLRWSVNVKRIASTSDTIFTRKAPLPNIFTDSDEKRKNPRSEERRVGKEWRARRTP